jgi:thymidylate kinase
MIVEFVGLMGAGKTTLHERAVRRLESAGRPFRTPRTVAGADGSRQDAPIASSNGSHLPLARLRRLVCRMRASWRSRRLVALAVRHLFGSGRPYGDTLKGLRWFLTDLGNHWSARLTVPSDHVVLLDEGIVQRMFNIFVHGGGRIDLAGIKAYARALPAPDVLIYLMVSSDVAMHRTQMRSGGLSQRFRGLTHTQLQGVFADAARALDVLVNEIRKSAPHPLIVVIETSDLERARQELSARLDAILTVGEVPTPI